MASKVRRQVAVALAADSPRTRSPYNSFGSEPKAYLFNDGGNAVSAHLAETREQLRTWGDRSLLRSLKNPTQERYRIQLHCPEVTFVGRREQPDFACLDIAMYPSDRVIELKSLKRYLFSFREELMSYERFINVLYEDLMTTYRPERLIVRMRRRSRGGIASQLTIDSAWRESPIRDFSHSG